MVVGWPPGSESIQGLLGRISIGEGTGDDEARRHYPSGSDYDVVFHYQPTSKPLSQMTLDEVSEFQRGMTGPTALGRYQFLRGTLADMKKYFALTGSEVFIPELQDRMARRLLERRRFGDYVDGRITAEQFQRELAKEWDSIEMPGTGLTGSYHAPRITSAQIQQEILQIARGK